MNTALLKLADIANCVSGDFHLLHLNYRGENFDTMHKQVLKEYYEQAAEDYDTWAEAALMFGGVVQSPNNSSARNDWDSEEGVVDYTRAVVVTEQLLNSYCAALIIVFDELEKDHSYIGIGISNTLQTRIEYWSKELAYFNARRVG